MSVVPFLEAARINVGRHPAVVLYHLVADAEAAPHVPGADRNFSALSRATGRQGRLSRARLTVLCGGSDDALPGRQPSAWIIGGKARDSNRPGAGGAPSSPS